MVPSSSILDAGSLHILEQLKYGKINIRQAAELLKVEPTILAYELAAKVFVMILTKWVMNFHDMVVFSLNSDFLSKYNQETVRWYVHSLARPGVLQLTLLCSNLAPKNLNLKCML